MEKEKAFSSESEYGMCMCTYVCVCLCVTVGSCLNVCLPPTEVDMDVDDLEVNQVDRLNVMALEYGVPAGLFSK